MNETAFKGKHGTILQIDAGEIWYIDGFRVSYFRRANVRSRGSCIADLSSSEKQLFLSFGTKDLMYRLLACILHTAALNTDPDSCPPEVKSHPMKTIY